MGALLLTPLAAQANVDYVDLTGNPFYDEAINYFTAEHFVQGDMGLDGKPTGTFRPNGLIARSEMAKIVSTFALTEQYGEQEEWNTKSNLELVEVILSKLKLTFNCDHGACSSLGGQPFLDVKERPYKVCQQADDEDCKPWYTPYVYHSLSLERIKGYSEDGNGNPLPYNHPDSEKYFHPDRSILRIHALKMMLVDNGNIPPEQDTRFPRLSLLAQERLNQLEQNNQIYTDCLAGAHELILQNNQNEQDPQTLIESQWLLDYAILANKLGFYGDQCQVMSEYGVNFTLPPEQRLEQVANFLQKPITRKEVMVAGRLSIDYHAPDPEMTWEEYEEQYMEEKENVEEEGNQENVENQDSEEVPPPHLDPESEEFDPEAYLELLEEELLAIAEQALEEEGLLPDPEDPQDPENPNENQNPDQPQEPYNPYSPQHPNDPNKPSEPNAPSIPITLPPLPDLEDWSDLQDYLEENGVDSDEFAKKIWNKVDAKPQFAPDDLAFIIKDHYHYVSKNSPFKLLNQSFGRALVWVEGYSNPYWIGCDQLGGACEEGSLKTVEPEPEPKQIYLKVLPQGVFAANDGYFWDDSFVELGQTPQVNVSENGMQLQSTYYPESELNCEKGSQCFQDKAVEILTGQRPMEFRPANASYIEDEYNTQLPTSYEHENFTENDIEEDEPGFFRRLFYGTTPDENKEIIDAMIVEANPSAMEDGKISFAERQDYIFNHLAFDSGIDTLSGLITQPYKTLTGNELNLISEENDVPGEIPFFKKQLYRAQGAHGAYTTTIEGLSEVIKRPGETVVAVGSAIWNWKETKEVIKTQAVDYVKNYCVEEDAECYRQQGEVGFVAFETIAGVMTGTKLATTASDVSDVSKLGRIEKLVPNEIVDDVVRQVDEVGDIVEDTNRQIGEVLDEFDNSFINQSSEAILKNGYYEVNGFKFSEYYYDKLWDTGRGAPSLVAKEVLENADDVIEHAFKEGFYEYKFGDWEMVYNPSTKEIWHLQPIN